MNLNFFIKYKNLNKDKLNLFIIIKMSIIVLMVLLKKTQLELFYYQLYIKMNLFFMVKLYK